MAGKVQVRWETESAATPMGQLAYFIQFLHLTGVWSRWLADCPLTYGSPNAPSIADVLGTWMLSILSGHRRYSHVATIRGDGVNPGLLEMSKVVSEDALRKGLLRIPEAAGTTWLDGHLDESTAALLDAVSSLAGRSRGATSVPHLCGRQLREGGTPHRKVSTLRQRSVSNRQMAAAAATFSDSVAPGIGICNRWSVAASTAGRMPRPSLPKTQASDPCRLAEYKLTDAASVVATDCPR